MNTHTARNTIAFYLVLAAIGIAACFTVTGSAPLHAQSNRFGALPFRASALGATKLAVSNGPIIVDAIVCMNPNASAAFLQIFNAKAASVTVGTTVPDWAVSFPNSGALVLTNLNLNLGIGATIAATTTATGNTGPGSALDCNLGLR